MRDRDRRSLGRAATAEAEAAVHAQRTDGRRRADAADAVNTSASVRDAAGRQPERSADTTAADEPVDGSHPAGSAPGGSPRALRGLRNFARARVSISA
jgi:hypothetical protein